MSQAADYVLNTREQLTDAIERLRAAGQHAHAELFEAARAGRILVMFAPRTAEISMRTVKRQARPVLVIVGDDDYAATGPAGWPKAEALMRWCNRVVIHGSGAEPWQYKVIAETTVALRRVLLVETSSDFIEAWRALAGNKSALIVVPTGGQHPVPETRH